MLNLLDRGMNKKNSNKRTNFKKLSFRLSDKQVNSLYNYCEIKGMTPNKLIKELLKTYTEEYTDEKIGKEKADKRQLKLFTSPVAEDFEQLKLFS